LDGVSAAANENGVTMQSRMNKSRMGSSERLFSQVVRMRVGSRYKNMSRKMGDMGGFD
jgi:hypothetical protein